MSLWRPRVSLNSGSNRNALLFNGKDGIECESFIRAVRQRAFEAEKTDDHGWIAGFASTCFADRALRWHSNLSAETQRDWSLLEKALLRRYLPDDRDEESWSQGQASISPARIPTAAPALPVAAPAPVPKMQAQLPQARKQAGRIRVVSEALPSEGYICSNISDNGHYWVTLDLARALIVQISPSSELLKVQMLNSATGRDWMGIQWKKKQIKAIDRSTDWAKVVMVSKDTDPSTTVLVTSSGSCLGPGRSAAWNLSPTGMLEAKWIADDNIEYSLDTSVDNKKALFLMFDYTAYSKVHPKDQKAQMIFEAL